MFWWRRAQLEWELQEELELHAELTQDARRMGNLTLAQEQSRELWSFSARRQRRLQWCAISSRLPI